MRKISRREARLTESSSRSNNKSDGLVIKMWYDGQFQEMIDLMSYGMCLLTVGDVVAFCGGSGGGLVVVKGKRCRRFEGWLNIHRGGISVVSW